jgi:hypothetical protein
LVINMETGRPQYPPLQVRYLVRYELGTPYPVIVDKVKALTERLIRPCKERKRYYQAALLADATGVGRAVVDTFNERDCWPIPVTIHGGSEVKRELGRGTRIVGDRYNKRQEAFRVPKKDLVSAVQVALQNGRLKFSSGLPLLPTLKEELRNFRMKQDPKTAHESFEHWRERDHDDMVLAIAMACWYISYLSAGLERQLAGYDGRYYGPGRSVASELSRRG